MRAYATAPMVLVGDFPPMVRASGRCPAIATLKAALRCDSRIDGGYVPMCCVRGGALLETRNAPAVGGILGVCPIEAGPIPLVSIQHDPGGGRIRRVDPKIGEFMPEIEYFYSAHSAFAYLGSGRLMQIAAAAGRRIVHRPFDLRRAVPASGSMPFGKRSLRHVAYYFGREIERWSEHRQVPVVGHLPTHHRNDPGLANRMLIAASLRGIDVDRLAHAMLEAHWRRDVDLADRPTLLRLGSSVDLDSEALLLDADTPKAVEIYEANTEEAIRRSVFGSPTYFVDGDMFYGQDRLEMVERTLQRRYAGEWPSCQNEA